MKLLVTGGCGFIGSNFLRFVVKERLAQEVVCLDSLTYAGNLSNILELKGEASFSFLEGDICDQELLASLKGFDAVVNFAAESHVDRSIESSEDFVRTNILGTQKLLDSFRETRFVQVSTDEVYGSLGETGLFYEDTPLDPSSPYSASKAAADLLCQAAYRTHGQNVSITRCTNNYGPYQFPEKLIPLFLTNLFEGKKVPLYGDGKNVRSWIHVMDHARAVWTVLEKGSAGEIYNIGSGAESEKSNVELTHQILGALGKGEEMIEYVEDRLGHDRRYAVDSSKIERELGWTPLVDFEQGLQETISWYKENRTWWGDVKSGAYRDCKF